MNNNHRECHCLTPNERACCALRDKLADGRYECQSLAPWERELYGEHEPYVDLYVNRGGHVFGFPHVRGIKYQNEDNVLTWEDENENIVYFPRPDFWHNESCDQ